ncbi:macro domain-containing protein [Streptomyces kutzneri]|uniref:macro domain-containing protein n=1 Tax=Streptomyces kutzneri TaxID=3051179 RepID=UPI0028D2804E|nr:macro domain-containing protein [Streptomyces sp. DSM 40907]
MSPLLLTVTTILIGSGIFLQIWSSRPVSAGRQYALQLPAILLYSLASALFLFSTFPDSLTEGRALGFRVGGAAGFAAFFMLASFAWLSKSRPRDELAAVLKRAKEDNVRLREQLFSRQTDAGAPRTLIDSTRYETQINGDRRHRIGVVTGNLANVFGTDVWINPENTRMEMSRTTERTISATIRYLGGRRDVGGHLVHDTIALELSDRMAGQSQVAAGQVLVTGPGELQESHQVKRIIHVAAVEGEPGSGFRQVMDLERCVRNALTAVDRLNEEGEGLRSIVLPLLGTGGGSSDLQKTVDTLVAATVGYFRAHTASRIRTVYLLAYTDVQAAVCRTALGLEPGLHGFPHSE